MPAVVWSRLLVVAALASVLLGVVPAHAAPPPGQYLDFARLPAFVSADPGAVVHLDRHGIPVVRYRTGTYHNSVTVAHWGLQNYDWWMLGRRTERDPAPLQIALRMADYLVRSQSFDGAWYYAFPYRDEDVVLEPPWVSANAQGMAISLLARMYAVTGWPRYLKAAKRGLLPFTRRYYEHGVRQLWNGHPWYEEYPGWNAQHVLNGFEFAVIGLYDLRLRSPLARRLFDAGVRSLLWGIGKFDAPGVGSFYAANHRGLVGDGYLTWHIVLTRYLFSVTGAQVLDDYASRWEKILIGHGRSMP
jgi:heparosan-N-sulfate-glucuronate 5-epimerase